MTFGEKLKAVRKQHGMVQKDLGDFTGVGQAAIANYEKGNRFPGEETLKRLTEVLNVSLDYLLSVTNIDSNTLSGIQDGIGVVFSADTLLQMLLNSPVEEAYSYILSGPDLTDMPLDGIFRTVLIPLLEKTGKLWASGDITVAEEHIISAKVREIVILLGDFHQGKKKSHFSSRGTWIGFCSPGDEHDLGILMISRLMKVREWNTFFLGIGPPLPSLLKAVERYQPKAIAVSITMEKHWNSLEAYIHPILKVAGKDCRMILGGQGIEGHEKDIAGTKIRIARSLDEAVMLAED